MAYRDGIRRALAIGVALLALGAAAVCPASEVTSLNDEGLAALARQDYPAAVQAFKVALELEPDSATLTRNLAAAYNAWGVDLLGRDEFRKAEAAFRTALKYEPHNDSVLGNLATAYNNRAVVLMEADSFTAAENYLLAAIRYRPDNETFRRNLSSLLTRKAKAYYDTHDSALALNHLREALQYDPRNATACLLLGQVCYEEQELGWALYYFRQANGLLAEPSADLIERIRQLEKEAGLEGQFRRQAYGTFDIRYDNDLKDFDLDVLRQYLSDAYYNIGGALGYYPRRKIVVIVYAPEDFAKLRSLPEWVGGLYDGKIRVPAVRATKDVETKRLIRHEYTHALVSDLSKDKCAVWLNEGLAKYMEYHDERGGMPTPFLKAAFRAGSLITFEELQGEFLQIKSPEKVLLAYEESYSIVRYIVGKYGMWKIKRMLARYGAGESTTGVLSREFYRTPARFEQEWLQSLKFTLD